MYYGSHGVKKGDIEAARWYRNAAEQGRPETKLSLSVRYTEGTGVEQISRN